MEVKPCPSPETFTWEPSVFWECFWDSFQVQVAVVSQPDSWLNCSSQIIHCSTWLRYCIMQHLCILGPAEPCTPTGESLSEPHTMCLAYRDFRTCITSIMYVLQVARSLCSLATCSLIAPAFSVGHFCICSVELLIRIPPLQCDLKREVLFHL